MSKILLFFPLDMFRNYYPIVLSVGILFLLVQLPVYADIISPAVKSDIEREQQERLKEIESVKQSIENITPSPALQEITDKNDNNCFFIKSLRFSGNHVFDTQDLLAITEFKPACLGLNSINNMLKKITNAYIEKGFVTTRAFLTPQDLSTGLLEIIIIEGLLEKVLFNGEQRFFFNGRFPQYERENIKLKRS